MPAGTAAARTYNRRSDHAPLAMSFLQDPPQLPDPWRSDRVLRGWLDWRLAPARRAGLVPHLEALAAHALGRAPGQRRRRRARRSVRTRVSVSLCQRVPY